MLASCGAKLGIAIRCATSDIELIPSASPKSAIPIGRPIATTEPNATSRITIAATRPISSPIPTPDSSNAKNRSPPISIWSGEPARCSPTNAFRRSRSARLSSSSTGYWTRMTATRPSGETTRRASSTFGSAAAPAWSSASAAPRSGVAPSRGVTTICAVRPARSEPAAREHGAGLRGVRPGHVERVLEVAAEARRRRRPRARRRRARLRRGVGAAGRESGRGGRGRRTWRRSSRRAAAVNIGRTDTLALGHPADARPHFRPMARPAPPVYGGAVASSAVRSFLAEPPAPDPPARVWRDWALLAVIATSCGPRDDLPRGPGLAAGGPRRLPGPVGHAPLAPHAPAARDRDRVRRHHAAGHRRAPVRRRADRRSCSPRAFLLLFPYALLRWGSGRDAAIGMGLILGLQLVTETATGNLGDLIAGAAFFLLSAALGAAVRYRTGSRLRERDQVRLREREQLARELHDTVAHHVSAIAVRAQAGRTLAATQPDGRRRRARGHRGGGVAHAHGAARDRRRAARRRRGRPRAAAWRRRHRPARRGRRRAARGRRARGRSRRPAADGRRRRLPDRAGVDHQRGPARAPRDPDRRPRHRRAGLRAPDRARRRRAGASRRRRATASPA